LPEINFKRTQIKIWQYLILPAWWISIVKEYQAKNKTIDEIKHSRNKYNELELLINYEINSFLKNK
jgi:hypothetical protein